MDDPETIEFLLKKKKKNKNQKTKEHKQTERT